MKTIIDIEDKLEKGYAKHCEAKLAELVAQKLEVYAIIDGLYAKAGAIDEEIDNFDFDDPELRSRYFGKDMMRDTGSKAVDDYVK